MTKLILVANWKNHPESPEAARSIVAGISKRRSIFKQLSLYIAPPLAYFDSVAQKITGFGHLAVQDLPLVVTGTYTGEMSDEMLKSFGVRLSIIGHSERRELGESDKQVAEKVKKALSAGIIPLVCIGEKTHDAEGEHLEFLRMQIRASLDGLKKNKNDVKKVVVAYEPVWAVGKKAKRAITPEDLAQMVIFIRKVLADLFGRDVAEKIVILYGGSVDPSNVRKLAESTGIKGFLVGRASLDAKQFAEIAGELTTK
jgi:triosephosphate isomerase (TIM)